MRSEAGFFEAWPSWSAKVRLFDVLWSQVWLLQLAKEGQLGWAAPRSAVATLSIVALAVSVASCLVSAVWAPVWYEGVRVRVLSRLAASGLWYLAMRGSSSNHVVLEGVLCVAVLEARLRGGSFEARLQAAARGLLGALYLVTFVAKMNSGFTARRSSCASLFAAVATADFSLPDWAFDVAPILALLGECALGIACWAMADFFPLTLVGAAFHVGLTMPKPPFSVYPFSMMMAPLFALAAHDRGPLWPALVLFPLVLHLVPKGEFYEYPPYGSWRAGVAWCSAAFAAVALASAKRRPAPKARRGAPLATALVFLVGALPYLGVRTHPCFAMFSNLRLETRSNHWLFTDPVLRAIDLGGGRMTDLVLIDDASPEILRMRLDLSAYSHDRDVIASKELDSQFVISPPPGIAFPHNSAAQAPGFAATFHELRRHLSSLQDDDRHLFVRYTRRGATARFDRFPNGTVTATHRALLKPLPTLHALLFRFRTFDLDQAPCRH
mmetsp:Transcript_6965/g.21223  ORF Transcript_6965/g.21223 Transcript_6965/m.21223 type:complete len:496 (-) Transcript_6965:441-1928(-)